MKPEVYGQLYKLKVCSPDSNNPDPTGCFVQDSGIILRFWRETGIVLILTQRPVRLPKNAQRVLQMCDYTHMLSDEAQHNKLLKQRLDQSS